MTPSFPYMGGKARMRKWLIQHFPKTGRRYLEPFAGVGNVFFLSKQQLDFQYWHLGDINPFLQSLSKADLEQLPLTVSRQEFQRWKNSDCFISKVIEPKVSFSGKGYSAGFAASHPTHKEYHRDRYKPICCKSQELLDSTDIRICLWDHWDYENMTNEDFVYFDPPYFETKASYPNINHESLIELLNHAKFRWALSGYTNLLYDEKLKFAYSYQKERNSEIKSLNRGTRSPVLETLWTNFPPQPT